METKHSYVDPTILWDTIKAIMRGKLISRTAYLKKEKRMSGHKVNTSKTQILPFNYKPKIRQRCTLNRKINQLITWESHLRRTWTKFRKYSIL
uniref:Uncharacterized protein n=1 Tax=Fundulus heteroclitus TaxID=8078 RepID=A0A3Q2QWS2_FUNHE